MAGSSSIQPELRRRRNEPWVTQYYRSLASLFDFRSFARGSLFESGSSISALRFPGVDPQLRLTSAPWNSSVNVSSDGRSRCSPLWIDSRNPILRFDVPTSSYREWSRMTENQSAIGLVRRSCRGRSSSLAPASLRGQRTPIGTARRAFSCCRPQRDWFGRPIRSGEHRERPSLLAFTLELKGADVKRSCESVSRTARTVRRKKGPRGPLCWSIRLDQRNACDSPTLMMLTFAS